MGPDQTTSRADACHRLARAVADVVSLPAVATLDWCERAAAAMTQLSSPSLVAVMVATTDHRGGLRRLEAAGVAGRARPYERAGPAIGPAADQASIQNPLPSDDPRITALRSRLERLDIIGWEPGDDGASFATDSRLADLPGGMSWRETGLGKLWIDIEPHDLLVSFQPLGPEEPGRGVLVYLATGGPEPSMGLDLGPGGTTLMCLKAVTPLLRERALMAIGSKVTTANRWLTVREQMVLDQLTLGKTVRQIAEDLDRSPHTVHDHVKSLHRKLNASSRGELIARALGHVVDIPGDARAAQTVEHKTSPSTSVPPATSSGITTIGASESRPRLVGSQDRDQK